MNFLNARDIVAILSAPPFSYNTPAHDVVIEVNDNDSIRVVGYGAFVEDFIRLVTDKNSSLFRFFMRKRTFFQLDKIVKRNETYEAILKIVSIKKR